MERNVCGGESRLGACADHHDDDDEEQKAIWGRDDGDHHGNSACEWHFCCPLPDSWATTGSIRPTRPWRLHLL